MRPSFWNLPVKVFILLASVVCLSVPNSSFAASGGNGKTKLEVGSFNIQVFGESKFNKPFVRQTILSIISRYDIIFIQEIRDDQNKAIFALLKELNLATGRDYHALVSDRMGRGEMKEQYAYFFDSKLVKAVDSYVFKDTVDDFAREPYVARFSSLGREFTLAGIHVAPNDVRTELRALSKVHRDVTQRFKDNNLLIMGDFNADCVYYKPVEGFDFFDEPVKVLVHDDEDTTVSPASCAYDRVLGFGPFLKFVSDAKPFNFQEQFNYDLASAKLISDHYPVEFTIDALADYTSDEGVEPEADGVIPAVVLSPVPEVTPIVIPAEVVSTPQLCGLTPYLTPGGYCYSSFEDGKVRVPDSCCSY